MPRIIFDILATTDSTITQLNNLDNTDPTTPATKPKLERLALAVLVTALNKPACILTSAQALPSLLKANVVPSIIPL